MAVRVRFPTPTPPPAPLLPAMLPQIVQIALAIQVNSSDRDAFEWVVGGNITSQATGARAPPADVYLPVGPTWAASLCNRGAHGQVVA